MTDFKRPTGPNLYWSQVLDSLRRFPEAPRYWSSRDFELLLEVESLLYLYEYLCPESKSRSAKDAWILVSGYCVRGINDTPEARRACLRLRARLRYVKTSSAWSWWLEWYVKRVPSELRLYELAEMKDGELEFQQRTYEVALKAQRISAYEVLWEEQPTAAGEPSVEWADAGKYTFQVNGVPQSIEISEAIAAFAGIPTPFMPLPTRTQRAPLEIDLDALLVTASELDALEQELVFEQPHGWYGRLEPLLITMFSSSKEPEQKQKWSLDGLFHLVGALGVGKSSLIWVLTYHLAVKEQRHVTIMVHTVVEALRLAAWLRKVGVRAAPAIGRNRADHERKYGFANSESINIERVLRGDMPPDPVLAWMPAPCALSALVERGIPIGQEPCEALEGRYQKRYTCPLLPVCPVHTLHHDLVESQVWVVNPMSFLHSLTPKGIGGQQIRLIEAVYRMSDILIIDEADRVQVLWDQKFAPTRLLAGSADAFLDALHRAISITSVGEQGRQRASQAAFNQLTRLDDQANTLSNRVFRLLAHSPRLAKWMKYQQATMRGMFSHLVHDLVKAAPRSMSASEKLALAEKLQGEFRNYRGGVLRRSRSFLATWMNGLLITDELEQGQEALENWLALLMHWKTPLKGRYLLLLRKLEFCLTLAAMLKRSNDLFYQLNWIKDEIGYEQPSNYELPDSVTDLVPDPPLGVMLGVRLLHRAVGEGLGVFDAMRYRGIGRWLLLNFPDLYRDRDGLLGSHVLLTSGTSWLPGAVQNHIAVPPNALLTANHTPSRIDISFFPVGGARGYALKVSGTGNRRQTNLRQIVRNLAMGSDTTPSHFQQQLDYWQAHEEKRRLLLVVNSYEQTEWVLEEFKYLPQWHGRVKRLIPDAAELRDDDVLRAREVEQFNLREADILVAPLMSIQRGFNILDQDKGALLGTAYFLVRPFTPPEDISPQILGLNAWLLRHLEANGRVLNTLSEEPGIQVMRTLRAHAYHDWHRRLKSGRRGIAKMEDDVFAEFLSDTFVVVWQTIGRLIRGERDANIFFIDSAFAPKQGKRHMLRDWHAMLDALVHCESEQDRYLANALYGTVWDAFDRAVEQQRIY